MADEILNPMKLYIQAGNLPDGMISNESFAEAVRAALVRYSDDSSREVFGGIAGEGGSVFDLSDSGLTGWDEEASAVTRVDHPWVIGEDNKLDFDSWEVVQDPTAGKSLHLIQGAAEVGSIIRVGYTVEWAEGTVPARHIPPVAKLAAANVARMLGARTAQSGESIISADSFHSTSTSQQWMNLAKAFEGQYEEGIGLGSDSGGGSGCGSGGTVKPAGVVWPMSTDGDVHNGLGSLTHD